MICMCVGHRREYPNQSKEEMLAMSGANNLSISFSFSFVFSSWLLICNDAELTSENIEWDVFKYWAVGLWNQKGERQE